MPPQSPEWPYLEMLTRLGLALAIGLFVGLERERRNKASGVRTFAFTAMLGCLGGLLGEAYALMILLLMGVLIAFLNVQSLQAKLGTELTTSVALLLITLAGILCGIGQTFTPVAVAVATTALLAWKEPLSGFSKHINETEIRSAILLGILAFIIYPALPEEPVDPWGIISAQATFITVLLIAGIGFVNYILWKIYGDRGIALTGFLGGLVNSMAAVSELSSRVKESDGQLTDVGHRGILLAVSAMILRNSCILAILAPQAFLHAAFAQVAMLICSALLIFFDRKPAQSETSTPLLDIKSPFSLMSALRFGGLFLVLQVISAVAQRNLGDIGLYGSTVLGSIVSSSSAVAGTASLASQGTIPLATAGLSTTIATFTSTIVTLPMIMRAKVPELNKRFAWAALVIMGAGILGVVCQMLLGPSLFPSE